MKSLLIVFMLTIFSLWVFVVPVNTVHAANTDCDPEEDIMLNMYMPFIGNCIKRSVDEGNDSERNIANVFPKTVGGLVRILMTAVIIFWFLGILTGWFMIAADGAFGTKDRGVQLIVTIITGLILLWASGIILNLINPDFFWTASWTTG